MTTIACMMRSVPQLDLHDRERRIRKAFTPNCSQAALNIEGLNVKLRKVMP